MVTIKRIIPRYIKKIVLKILNQLHYYYDYLSYWRVSDSRLSLSFNDRYPCLTDKTKTTSFDSHYLYHTAWAARVLAKFSPILHVDIGSCLRFISTVSAFITIDFYDFRPPEIILTNLNNKHADVTDLPFADGSINSLSCMHVIEHIGLGRYGDPLDPSGDLKAASELVRVLAKGGNLLFVVPISGRPRIEFNAHRIYSFSKIKDMFAELSLVDFSLIPDDAISLGIISNATEQLADRQIYGCGCFHFTKE